MDLIVEKGNAGRCVPFEGPYGYSRDHAATGWQNLALRALGTDRSCPFEGAVAIAGNCRLDRADVGQDGLRAGALAAVAAVLPGRVVFVMAEMTGDHALKGGLQHPLRQLLERSGLAGRLQVLGLGPEHHLIDASSLIGSCTERFTVPGREKQPSRCVGAGTGGMRGWSEWDRSEKGRACRYSPLPAGSRVAGRPAPLGDGAGRPACSASGIHERVLGGREPVQGTRLGLCRGRSSDRRVHVVRPFGGLKFLVRWRGRGGVRERRTSTRRVSPCQFFERRMSMLPYLVRARILTVSSVSSGALEEVRALRTWPLVELTSSQAAVPSRTPTSMAP